MYWQEALETGLGDLLIEQQLGLVSDFDGTLSPIVAEKDAAQMFPRSRKALQKLTPMLPLVALVSGRSAADLHARVAMDGAVYVGNHGFERWAGGSSQPMSAVAEYRPAIEAVMQQIMLAPGVELEDKGATLSIHYRNVEDPSAAAQVLGKALHRLAEAHGLKCSEGKMVFEIRPPLKVDKGTSLAALVEEYALQAVLWLGDDVTDVDAMRRVHTLRDSGRCRGYALGVESDDTPPAVRAFADALLRGIDDVADFLEYIVQRRQELIR